MRMSCGSAGIWTTIGRSECAPLRNTHSCGGHKSLGKLYTAVVGLPFTNRDPSRDIVFLWAQEREEGMKGLFGPSSGYGRQDGVLTECHLAFVVPPRTVAARDRETERT